MKSTILACAVAVALCTGAAAQSMETRYDALGRLKCVKYANGAVTKYRYDESGNRLEVTTPSGASCQAQSSPNAPPTAPNVVSLTVFNPNASMASRGSASAGVSALGASSDGGALTLQAATAGGVVSSCGTVTRTTSSFTYTAPLVTPVGATRQCWVNYTLAHSNGQSAQGRASFLIAGEEESGGGGDDPPPPPPGCFPSCPNEN